MKLRVAVSGPLAESGFRQLMAGRTLMFLGSAIAPVAVAFAVLNLTNSPAALGLVLASYSVPNAAFLVLGGTVSDRMPRHTVMVTFSLIAGVIQAIAAILLLTGDVRVWQLAVAEAVIGVCVAFVIPAAQGTLPNTVPANILKKANSISRMGLNAATIIGGGAGGLVVAAFGPGWGTAADATTLFTAAALFAGLRPYGPRTEPGGASMWQDLAEGWREFRSRTWLWAGVGQCCFVNAAMAGGFWILGPVIADRQLGGAGSWGWIVTAQGIGFVIGGAITLRLQPRRPLLLGVVAISFASPLLLFLAIGATLPTLVAAAVFCGIGYEIYGVFWDTAMQNQIPPDLLSRLYAYDSLGSFVFIPIGQVAVGPARAAFGIHGTIGWACAVIILATLSVLLVPEIRRYQPPATAA